MERYENLKQHHISLAEIAVQQEATGQRFRVQLRTTGVHIPALDCLPFPQTKLPINHSYLAVHDIESGEDLLQLHGKSFLYDPETDRVIEAESEHITRPGTAEKLIVTLCDTPAEMQERRHRTKYSVTVLEGTEAEILPALHMALAAAQEINYSNTTYRFITHNCNSAAMEMVRALLGTNDMPEIEPWIQGRKTKLLGEDALARLDAQRSTLLRQKYPDAETALDYIAALNAEMLETLTFFAMAQHVVYLSTGQYRAPANDIHSGAITGSFTLPTPAAQPAPALEM